MSTFFDEYKNDFLYDNYESQVLLPDLQENGVIKLDWFDFCAIIRITNSNLTGFYDDIDWTIENVWISEIVNFDRDKIHEIITDKFRDSIDLMLMEKMGLNYCGYDD